MNLLVVQFSLTFILAVAVGCMAVWYVRRIALAWRIIDVPDVTRKIHHAPVPLLGGLALYITIIMVGGALYSVGWLTDPRITPQILTGLIIAGGVLVSGGYLDDRFGLPWWLQIMFPLCAVTIMLASGLTVGYVTNPFGGVYHLEASWIWVPIGPLVVMLWLLGMTYTTKLLDGVDGLAASVSFVATIILFVVSLFWDRTGSTTSFLALCLAGALVGFLIWNWYPAKIFLGEGGSTFLGFMLGVLAIISGAKIATALLVMGVPILDVVWIIIRRMRSRQHLFRGDAYHLHFRLLRAGMSQRQVVLFLSFLSLLFGSVSLFTSTIGKLIALACLVAFTIGLFVMLASRYDHQNP